MFLKSLVSSRLPDNGTRSASAFERIAGDGRVCALFPNTSAGGWTTNLDARDEERLAERTRIAQELHDTLLQGFFAVSMQLHAAADHLPEDSTAKVRFTSALEAMDRGADSCGLR